MKQAKQFSHGQEADEKIAAFRKEVAEILETYKDELPKNASKMIDFRFDPNSVSWGDREPKNEIPKFIKNKIKEALHRHFDK